MALNNNAEFYKKVLSKIIFVFCISFLIILNVIRFSNLINEKKEPTPQPFKASKFFFSINFFEANQKESPKIVLIDSNGSNAYLKSIIFEKDQYFIDLYFLKNRENSRIYFINCAQNKIISKKMNTVFKNNLSLPFEEILCHENSNEYLKFLSKKNSVLVFALRPEYFLKNNIISLAQTQNLAPKVKITEVKYAH